MEVAVGSGTAVSVGICVSVGRGSGVSDGTTTLVGLGSPALPAPLQALTRKTRIKRNQLYLVFFIGYSLGQ